MKPVLGWVPGPVLRMLKRLHCHEPYPRLPPNSLLLPPIGAKPRTFSLHTSVWRNFEERLSQLEYLFPNLFVLGELFHVVNANRIDGVRPDLLSGFDLRMSRCAAAHGIN